MPKRVLVLGTTGVDKQTALSNLKSNRSMSEETSNLHILDFEKDFIVPEFGLYDYLDGLEAYQRTIWQTAWKKCADRLRELEHQDVILSIHGVLVRPLYGVRSSIHLNDLKEFKPDKIITLIDDVYLKWHRTELRAQGLDFRGRPTLEQLLSARRAEMFCGDIFSHNIAPDTPIKNYVLAVRHPARVMERLVYGPRKLKPIYLSFPISGPRRLEKDGDMSGINEINNFLQKASAFEQRSPQVAFFCPLSIDEFPLIRSLDSHDGVDENLNFDLSLRWDVREFWHDGEILLMNEDTLPDSITLRRDQVEHAKGFINPDVATRDYRLVLQSRGLAVFNPFFNGELSRGVFNEIRCAVGHKIPTHIFQDSKHDPKNQAEKQLRGEPGSLGRSPDFDYVIFHETLEELFAKIAI